MADEERKQIRWSIYLMIAMTLLFVYPFSRGPLHWLIVHGVIPAPVASLIVTLYAPAAWVIDQTPTAVQESFQRYLNLW